MLETERSGTAKVRGSGGYVVSRLAFIAIASLSIGYTQAQSNNIADIQSISLKFTSIDGRKVDINSLKGKIILIDCWATWCAPCLKEMSHIKELYEKYHSRGFEVIGISMDERTSKERVKQIIQEKNISWPQRFEGKGFQEDSFRRQYHVTSLPTVYLLDREGKIVDTNARGELLEQLLQQYLGL